MYIFLHYEKEKHEIPRIFYSYNQNCMSNLFDLINILSMFIYV